MAYGHCFRSVCLIALLLITALPVCSVAQSIDDALEGFEEDNTDTSNELDDVLGGFDSEPTQPVESTSSSDPSLWDLTGSLTLGSSVNFAHKAPEDGMTDHRGLSRLRLKGGLTLDVTPVEDWKIRVGATGHHDTAYAINGRDRYTDETLDEMESELRLKEAYVQGKLGPNLDLKFGRQIVVWGKSDNIRITDILNPLDNREPGMVDIEDLREPVTMTKLDYYHKAWSFSAIAVHEIRFNYNPPFGSDFFPGGGSTSRRRYSRDND